MEAREHKCGLIRKIVCFYIFLISMQNSQAIQTNSSQATNSSSLVNAEEEFRNCDNTNAYETLQLCMQECKKIHRNIPTPPPSTEEPTPEEKMKFKVVKLKSNEFSLQPGGALHTNLPLFKISSNSFVLSEDETVAFVCYPLDEDFLDCKKWFLFEDEIEFRDNTRSLWSVHHKQLHSLGKFYTETVEGEIEAAVCQTRSESQSPIRLSIIMGYAVSAVSLIATVILSVLIPKLNMRHNYILSCYIVIFAFAYLMLLISSVLKEITVSGCLVLALLKQFFLLSTFFWINVQAIDLCIRFFNLRGHSDMKTSMRRFIFYCLYAWGCPTIICCITLGMEKTDAQKFHPKFEKHCWFDKTDQLTVFIYFYGPITFILLANGGLFVMTIMKLYKLGKNASNVNKKMHKQLLLLYLKLIVVMGLCWIMEIISWAVGGDEMIWFFTDLINAYQGVLIFIVYVLKPAYVRRLVNQTFPTRPTWWPWKDSMRQDDATKTHVKSVTASSSAAGIEATRIIHSNV